MRIALITIATLTALSTAACGPMSEAGEDDVEEISIASGKADGVPITLDTGSGDVTIPSGTTAGFPLYEPSTTVTFPTDTSATVTFPTGTIVTIPGYPPITVGWAAFEGDSVTIPYNGKRLVVHTGMKPLVLKFGTRLAIPAGKLYWSARAYVALHTQAKVSTMTLSAPVVY